MVEPKATVGGIDEAGRGSIIGPLVVAGVCASAEALKEFEEMGVRDSKMLSPEARSSLYCEIVRLSKVVHFAPIEIDEIDHYVFFGTRRRKLNFLEALHMAKVIPMLEAEEVFVDAPDTNPRMFTEELSGMLDPCPRIVAQHKADRNFVVVSAASIVAKVERDRAVELLRGVHGDFGSGYPSDPQTISFLKEWVLREGLRPAFSRKSWKTWDRILVTTLDASL
ncbi:MAG: ribonuclease HII [Thaumarchaeota archaeon]|nr:ribonuclease HII [Nitrososphaerota archaeon]